VLLSRERRATATVVALLVAASGCAVGPDYKRPRVSINAQWSAAADARLASRAPVDEQWWRSFNDATLDHLVALAWQQNLPLQIAGLRILEARAQLGIAIGQQYPSNPRPIGSAQVIGLDSHTSSGDLDLLVGNYQVGFDAVWEPDFWGKFRRGVRAARAGWLATVADYDDALVSLAAEVARTYVLIRSLETQLSFTRENVAVQEESRRIAEARFRNGATSELDVAQAVSQLETTRQTVPELEIELAHAENALCTLLGRPSGCAATLIAPGAIPAVPAQVAVGVPAELLRRRPDIRSAELSAMAQCDRIGVAKAELYPSFSLSGAIGTRTVNTSGAPSGLGSILGIFGAGSLLWSFGANLFWPILNYPKLLNNVRVQDARFEELLFSYQNTVLKAAQEVEDATAGFLREQQAAVFAENAVAAAQLAVKLALVQYREGAVDFQRVLDAQRSLLTSQNASARTRSAVATNLVALYKALGGGWELRAGEPVITDDTRDEMKRRTNWGRFLSKPPPSR
jgi:NodT family efflux transporter outer membrane factor (OMF) lipoprotein